MSAKKGCDECTTTPTPTAYIKNDVSSRARRMIHILFTLTGCDAALIDSEEHVRQVLFDACQTAKTTWLQTASHKFEPQVTT